MDLKNIPVINNLFNQLCDSGDKSSLICLLIKGGWVMIPLLILSVWALYIVIKKNIQIYRLNITSNEIFGKTKKLLISSNSIEMQNFLTKKKSTALSLFLSNLISRYLNTQSFYVKQAEVDIEIELNNTMNSLGSNIEMLKVISSLAPMLGFLGTVTGLIKSFMAISQIKAPLDFNLMSTGIYEAMLTTAVGLIVGIFSFLFYNLLIIKLQKCEHTFESEITRIKYNIIRFLEKVSNEKQ